MMEPTPDAFRRVLGEMTSLTADMAALNARLDERRKLNAIITAYDLATLDPKFKCPSYLMAAIERARLG